LSTERAYVNDLGVIINSIIPAASTVLKKKDIDTLFTNVSSLYALNLGLAE